MEYASYELSKAEPVFSVATGKEVSFSSLLGGEQIYTIVFLTHWGDIGAWELARKVQEQIAPKLKTNGMPLAVVGLGSVSGGKLFAEKLKIPADNLFACPGGEIYRDLAFSEGYGAASTQPTIVKQLAMLAGQSSPGTPEELLKSDKLSARALNAFGILSNWKDLAPAKQQLITQLGGAVILQGKNVQTILKDAGTLKYVDVDKVLNAALKAKYNLLGRALGK
jgi:hypothetical protein